MVTLSLDSYKLYQSQSSGSVPTRTLGLQGGWIMRSHIGWRGKRRNLSVKTLRGNFERKLQREQYLEAVGLDYYK